MWHKASEELPEVGQLVITRHCKGYYKPEVYLPGAEEYFDQWTEFPVNGWLSAENIEVNMKRIVIAKNDMMIEINGGHCFDKSPLGLVCINTIFKEYQYLPEIDE